RRPDIVVLEKESNKAIIVDIASPWYHRVYDKESEKVKKYQDLKWEIRKLWGIRHVEVDVVQVVVGALGAVSKRLDTWLDKREITINTSLLQKTALLRAARILRKKCIWEIVIDTVIIQRNNKLGDMEARNAKDGMQ
ncbi:unnamed protein product, partial [Porites evermanni]